MMELMRLNTAVLAPIPKANVRATAKEKPGRFIATRAAARRSRARVERAKSPTS